MTATTSLFSNTLYKSNRPALICGEKRISYAQLARATIQCRGLLRKAGIRKHSRIAIFADNSPDYIVILLSLWSLKAVACPLNTRLPLTSLLQQLKQLKCSALITDSRQIIKSNEICVDKLRITDLSGLDYVSRYPNLKIINTLFSISSKSSATILFTSSSSGTPKAVVHSLANHLFSARGVNNLIRLSKGDAWLLSLPLYHVGGLSILFRVFTVGACLIIPKRGEIINQAVIRYPITRISLVPTQFTRLINHPACLQRLRGLKSLLLGGSPVGAILLKETSQIILPVFISYGMTETSSLIASARYPRKPKIHKYCRIRISKHNEIFVKGQVLCQGYWDGEKIKLPKNRGGWFATGDLGVICEQRGLIITGRKDNMFISGGENIQPEEIELCLCRHKSVQQAVVVPISDNKFGFRPVAFVLMNHPDFAGNKYGHSLSLFLDQYLPRFKIPVRYYPWPKSLDNHSVKIIRRDFIRMAENCRTMCAQD